MRLSDTAAEEFKQLWIAHYGKELTDEEAREYGTRLISMFETLLKIDQRINKKAG